MKIADWKDRWETKQIGFHLSEVNPYLLNFFHLLSLSPGQKIFVPLCGKSIDLHFLKTRGLDVWGIEVSTKAIAEFFVEQKLSCKVEIFEQGKIWKSDHITIIEADLFSLAPGSIKGFNSFNAIWDRASCVAINPEERHKYLKLIKSLMGPGSKYLFDGLTHNGKDPLGPPFSINQEEFLQFCRNQLNLNFQILAEESNPATNPKWSEQNVVMREWVCLASS